MFRTFAVLLLLVGLATATPVVCLCAPDGVVGLLAQPGRYEARGGLPASDRITDSLPVGTDASSLISTSAAAAVASVVATAAGLPSTVPWQAPQPVSVARVTLLSSPDITGQVWPPDAPPPQMV